MAGENRRNWTHDETLMAFVLYYMLPSNEIDDTGADVIALANAIGRTPNAVAMKAWNIAAHDMNRVGSGKVGMPHGSKLDALIWEEFEVKGDALIEEGFKLLEKTVGAGTLSPEISYAVVGDVPEGEGDVPEGKVHEVVRSERVNQQYFRNTLMKNYSERCCITGIAVPALLVASHIKPWKDADPKTERLTGSNGLLLNALHDRAFDKGLMTIDCNHKVVLSSKLKRDVPNMEWLFRFEGEQIVEPKAMPPAREFIEYHNDVVFIG